MGSQEGECGRESVRFFFPRAFKGGERRGGEERPAREKEKVIVHQL